MPHFVAYMTGTSKKRGGNGESTFTSTGKGSDHVGEDIAPVSTLIIGSLTTDFKN